jgi:hypothetical protein
MTEVFLTNHDCHNLPSLWSEVRTGEPTVARLSQKIYRSFTEPELTLLRSQERATGPYFGPDES